VHEIVRVLAQRLDARKQRINRSARAANNPRRSSSTDGASSRRSTSPGPSRGSEARAASSSPGASTSIFRKPMAGLNS